MPCRGDFLPEKRKAVRCRGRADRTARTTPISLGGGSAGVSLLPSQLRISGYQHSGQTLIPCANAVSGSTGAAKQSRI
jgi:hypothetical protein